MKANIKAIEGIYPVSVYSAIKRDNTNIPLMNELATLNGLKWNVLGDSLSTEEHGRVPYHKFISQKEGVKINYYAVGGTKISGEGSSFINRYLNMSEDADIITVMGGGNDHTGQVPLGDINSINRNEFYGALNILCEGLMTRFAGKKVAFFTPTPRRNLTGTYPSIDVYVKAIKEVCEKWHIPVLDLHNMCCMNPNLIESHNSIYYTGDKIHPNSKTQEYIIAPKISTFLKSL